MNCKETIVEVPIGTPYINDLFGLSPFGDFLKGIVDSYSHTGAVIALNGEWGTGKSTFLKMWHQSLKDEGYRTLFLNAWECDFHDDPMIAIMGEMAENFSDKEGRAELISKAGRLIIAFTKDVVKNVFEKTTGLNFESLIDEASEIASEAVRSYHQKKSLLQDFKNQLSKFVVDPNNNTPVVFIIDELDRCSPHFAVKLLERLKHIFEVPNVIFVLGVNADQLQYAIQGFYGSSNIDGREYLKRFFDVDLKLPKPNLNTFCNSLFESQGINKILNIHKASGSAEDREKELGFFTQTAKDLFIELNINPRKVFRIVHYMRLVLEKCSPCRPIDADLVFLLCFLKVNFPLTFENIKNHNYSIQELLNAMETIFHKILLSNSDNNGPQGRTIVLIGKLILLYNRIDGGVRKFDQTFVQKVNKETNTFSYPLTTNIIAESELFEIMDWEEKHYRDYYNFNIERIISRVDLTEHLS